MAGLPDDLEERLARVRGRVHQQGLALEGLAGRHRTTSAEALAVADRTREQRRQVRARLGPPRQRS